MAAIYGNASGAIIGIAETLLDQVTTFAVPPTGTEFTILIDESIGSNAAIIAEIVANQNAYSVPGGVLKQGPTPVLLASASSLFGVATTIFTSFPQSSLASTIAALWAGTATAVQQQQGLAYVLLLLYLNGGAL